MGRPFQLLLILLLTLAISLAKRKEFIRREVHTPVGKLFSVRISESLPPIDLDSLPPWLDFNDTAIYGIPQYGDMGEYTLVVSSDEIVDVYVEEEVKNPCEFQPTVWMEVYKNQPLAETSVKEQAQIINDFAVTFDMKQDAFRLYEAGYLNRLRDVEYESMNELEHPAKPTQPVIMWKLSCQEFDMENDFNVIEIATRNYEKEFRIVQGRIKDQSWRDNGMPSFMPPQSATDSPSGMRTTRKVDHPPQKLNSLPTFYCKKGMLCNIAIPANTFADPEDGDTRNLKLAVYPLEANTNTFLVANSTSSTVKGVSLETGTFRFRLEARDKANQVASAPFQVVIEDSFEPNHHFVIILDKNLKRFNEIPGVLGKFVETLSRSLNVEPSTVRVNNVISYGTTQTQLTWSNTTLSRKVCQDRPINATYHQMVHKKHQHVKLSFVRQMGAQFHVRQVNLDYSGSCLPKADELKTTPGSKKATTPVPIIEVAPSKESMFSTLLLPLILFIIFLVVLSILILLCCVLRKKSPKKKPSEYVTKGHPVVFPEEIPREDEELSTVATPMLVKEERGPLSVTSIHENPLYKPPSSTPLMGRASSSTPMRSSMTPAAHNQRMPPPYVAP